MGAVVELVLLSTPPHAIAYGRPASVSSEVLKRLWLLQKGSPSYPA